MIKTVKIGKSIRLFQGDCLEVMKRIPDGSIDMVMSDPPYGTTACKWDSIIPLEPMWGHLKRVIKKNGTIVMTAIQPFTTTLISSNMGMFKYCWVWDKVRPVGAHVSKYRPMARHEDIVVWCDGKTTYNRQMVLRDKPRTGSKEYGRSEIIGGKVSDKFNSESRTYTHRNPTTIIIESNASNKGRKHPTQKPVALMEYLIKTYTNEGETVLDFAMGSGTTLVACLNLNRNGIGIEKDLQYFEMAKERIHKENLD